MKNSIPSLFNIPLLALILCPLVLQSPTLSDLTKGLTVGLFLGLFIVALLVHKKLN